MKITILQKTTANILRKRFISTFEQITASYEHVNLRCVYSLSRLSIPLGPAIDFEELDIPFS